MITVASQLAERYALELAREVEVVLNVPFYREHTFHPTATDHIRLIHHGAAIPERKLELMIDALAASDSRYTLDFMLIDQGSGYIRRLQSLAKMKAPGRVRFREPVSPTHITSAINEYDIGLFLLPPVNFSYTYALPNKLFEFIMAGLAVVVGPSPEMAQVCRDHGLGVVANGFRPQNIAQTLNGLSANQIDQLKRNSLRAAKRYNAEVEMRKLMSIYSSLLAD
jgi:glycosyltransferase involved in cell wall biosynthesis